MARDFTAIVFDEPRDRVFMNAGNTFQGVLLDDWWFDLADLPTEVEVSAAAPDASPERVVLRWHVSSLAESYEVFRSDGNAVWQSLGTARPSGDGILTWEDRNVQSGQTYAYRLHYSSDGSMRHGGDLTVAIPNEFAIGLRAPSIVSDGRLVIEMSQPKPGDSQIELFDVGGRRVYEQTRSRPAGNHVVDLGGNWSPGVYWVRLHHAGTTTQQRVAILR